MKKLGDRRGHGVSSKREIVWLQNSAWTSSIEPVWAVDIFGWKHRSLFELKSHIIEGACCSIKHFGLLFIFDGNAEIDEETLE